jgi:hypothetical protein
MADSKAFLMAHGRVSLVLQRVVQTAAQKVQQRANSVSQMAVLTAFQMVHQTERSDMWRVAQRATVTAH